MTLLDEIEAIRKKIDARDNLASELTKKEEHFGMPTKDFLKKWRSGAIPEPEDPDLLATFQEWEGLAESLERIEGELKKIEDNIRAGNRSSRGTVSALNFQREVGSSKNHHGRPKHGPF